MTFLERKRAEHQAIYKEEQKYWADHAEEFTKSVWCGVWDRFVELIYVVQIDRGGQAEAIGRDEGIVVGILEWCRECAKT
jgi:hypothetical protein